jgi:predicted porin
LKKHLLSTSAIALGVAMASPAAAQQWDLAWGGFANTHIGASDIGGSGADGSDFDGVNVYTNSEVIFSPSVTLDNGLTFGFSVQMEALNGGGGQDGIDESYVTIEGDMLGKIVLGSENSAGYALMGSVYTPGVDTMSVNSRSTSAFVPVTGSTGFRQAGLSSLTEVAGNNDVQRISYFTPSFNGLTVGVSYAPSSAGNASNNAPVDFDARDITDIFDIGVGYQQSFGTVDLGFAARWGTGNSNLSVRDDPTTWAVGGTLGVSAFTFGATYSENDNGFANGENNGLTGGTGDQQGYSIGASYDIVGPWSVGGELYRGEEETSGGDNRYDAYKVAASRDLGAGVSWNVYYYYMETKNGVTGDKIDGNVIATAINLSF